jgi:hypothetical protein
MMPRRDGLVGTQVIVWGITTQKLINSCSIDFGDGPAVACSVTDNSYIAFPHTYATSGAYTATLKITGAGGKLIERATVAVDVFDPAFLTADTLREVRIRMAIQDGLRYLWTTQDTDSRTAFSATPRTNWGHSVWTALVVWAFENHGYKLPNDNTTPITGLYEKYVVRRGLNELLSGFHTETLNDEAAGRPCVGSGTDLGTSCTGLTAGPGQSTGYGTPIAMLPLAASGALSRTTIADELTTGHFTAGRSYGEVLQRLTNALAWGQSDANCGADRGGWGYSLQSCRADGSVAGWSGLAILAAEAAGTTLPTFLKSEFSIAIGNALNSDGTYDYVADANPGPLAFANMSRTGTSLQGLYFVDSVAPFALGSPGANALNYISDGWGNGGGGVICGSGLMNKGCAYSMFNLFKGLKLAGVTTLPGVTRPAGPGAQPAGDWYADYQDWLLVNQTDPTLAVGGNWSSMELSPASSGDDVINAAIAELILSPVALVPTDDGTFSTVGLSQATSSSDAGAAMAHTVTANTRSAGDRPVPGTTVVFKVLTGPNAGQNGTSTTGLTGLASFTYSDTGGAGSDSIQAFIGTMGSNTLLFTWSAPPVNAPPVVIVDGNIDTFATSEVGASVIFAVSSTDDLDNPAPAVICTAPSGVVVSGTTFPIGVTTVTCSATDSVGLSDSDTFTVTVRNNPPAFAAPPDVVAEATSPGGASVVFTAVGQDVEDGVVAAVCAPAAGSTFPLGATTVACVVTDAGALTAVASFVVTVVDTTPPAIVVPGPVSVHATSASGATVSFSASATDIVDGTDPVTCVAPSGSAFPIGTSAVACSSTDRAGNTSTKSFTVTVTNAAPVCSAVAPSIAQIWPANHKLIEIRILGVTDSDGDEVVIEVTSIFQDEKTNSDGDGNTAIDGYGVGTSAARVRAERDGNPRTPGNGRVYYIRFSATDGRGADCSGEVRVGVPHDQGTSPAIGDGPVHNSTVVTAGTPVKK